MPLDPSYIAYVEDQLSELGEFSSKRMFGGMGYFKEHLMFGAIMNNIFRLKADDGNKNDFIEQNMGPHQVPGRKMTMPYYQVPLSVMEDKATLAKWCLNALDAARRSKK